MKLSKRLGIFITALCIFLAGCGVKITNMTPDPLTRSANNLYTISAMIERDSGAVYSNTIEAKVTIDGTQYPMSGSGEGLWTYQHTTAPGASAFDVHYDVDYRYNYALLFAQNGRDRAPEAGDYHIDIIEPVASVSVAPASANIAIDTTQQFTATLRDANGNTVTGRDVNWSSSSNSIASINNSGLATGKRTGDVTITATSEGQNDTAALSVYEPVTPRQLGGFRNAQTNFRIANTTNPSPNGDYQVEIRNGNDVSSPHDLVAYFQTDNGNSIGSRFGFYVRNGMGGAGFSHCSDVGVVLSGNAGVFGYSSDFVFSRIDLDHASDTENYSVNFQDGAYSFQPRIQFSPDCTLMLIAGAHTSGAANNSLNIWDLLEDRVIASGVTFNTGQFSAEVVPDNNRFAVRIIIDNGAPMTYPIP